MGLYAFSLAGSNYATPIACGWVAEGMGMCCSLMCKPQ